ncbi:Hypp3991 [Branchiostoma lanceolatum]|uniref:Hypp3991 protein n=1 Tax=Branchiostoma lanceolatum TaxID=7740 RepID=A0A8K0A479_BRALA|nr:Hypp3991 [Branchiostoma lanceolatum]
MRSLCASGLCVRDWSRWLRGQAGASVLPGDSSQTPRLVQPVRHGLNSDLTAQGDNSDLSELRPTVDKPIDAQRKPSPEARVIDMTCSKKNHGAIAAAEGLQTVLVLPPVRSHFPPLCPGSQLMEKIRHEGQDPTWRLQQPAVT